MGSCNIGGGGLAMTFSSRKGYFFSLTVILLLLLVSAYFSSMSSPGNSERTLVASQRINEVNQFLSSVKRDAQTALSVASYRAFLSVDRDILRVDGYVHDDFDDIFEELVINGTLHGNNVSLMNYSSINEWVRKMTSVADQLIIRINFSDLEVVAFQESPWYVSVSLFGTVNVSDDFTDSSWSEPLLIVTAFPINDFFDPVYSVGSDQRYFQRFKRSNYTFSDELMLHIFNHTYIASNFSPGFLQRIQGNFSGPNLYGVESLVDVPALDAVGVVFNASIIDWQYFEKDNDSLCHAEGFPFWVVVDESQNSTYNVSCG